MKAVEHLQSKFCPSAASINNPLGAKLMMCTGVTNSEWHISTVIYLHCHFCPMHSTKDAMSGKTVRRMVPDGSKRQIRHISQACLHAST